MKNFSLILYITIIFSFLSCSEEKSEPPKNDEPEIVTPVEIDACSLIDKEVAEKIFNVKMKEPKKGRNQKGDDNKASFSECSFESDEGARIFLSVYVRFTPQKDEYHSTIQNVRNSFRQSDIDIKDVEGIGEVAFWGGNQFHVFKGNNYYIILTLLGIKEQEESIEKAKEVALHVMNNTDTL